MSEISTKRMKNIDENEQTNTLTTCSKKLHRYLTILLGFSLIWIFENSSTTPSTNTLLLYLLEYHLENHISQLKQRSRNWGGLQLIGDALSKISYPFLHHKVTRNQEGKIGRVDEWRELVISTTQRYLCNFVVIDKLICSTSFHCIQKYFTHFCST